MPASTSTPRSPSSSPSRRASSSRPSPTARPSASARRRTPSSAAPTYARKLVDDGTIGTVTAGTAYVMSHGMEAWHPNPGFFFQPGGGPILDLGRYYITDLVNLLGPVKRVAAITGMAPPPASSPPTAPSRTRRSRRHAHEHPRASRLRQRRQRHARRQLGRLTHRHRNIELYGTEGSIFVPDPNWFGGTVEVAGRDGKIEEATQWEHPFGVSNDIRPTAAFANYRTAGLADMALAILDDRPARRSLDLALHVVDVMTSILKSGEMGAFVDLQTTCERPAPLDPEAAAALLV